MKMVKLAALAIAFAAPVTAQAVVVDWTDWTAFNGTVVDGTITSGTTTIGVSYTGGVSGVQLSGGINYWTEGSPAPYTGGTVSNAPPTPDIIQLSTGGTGTITFSQAVVNPLIALVSWNGNVVDFGVPIEFVSAGAGFWGSGTFANTTATGFTGSGELHGIVRILGTYSTVSFSHTSEGWHGLTVGIEGVAPPGGGTEVPVPPAIALLATAVAGVGWLGRRRHR
jgi:hypothetical protein